MPPIIAAGAAWIAGGVGIALGGGAAAVAVGSAVGAAFVGACYGAIIGGVMAAVTGQNILKGALKGALIGGVTAGVMSLAGSALGAAGAGTEAVGTATVGTGVPVEGGMATMNVPVGMAGGADVVENIAVQGGVATGNAFGSPPPVTPTPSIPVTGGGTPSQGILGGVGKWVTDYPVPAGMVGQGLASGAGAMLESRSMDKELQAQMEMSKLNRQPRVTGLGDLDLYTVLPSVNYVRNTYENPLSSGGILGGYEGIRGGA